MFSTVTVCELKTEISETEIDCLVHDVLPNEGDCLLTALDIIVLFISKSTTPS